MSEAGFEPAIGTDAYTAIPVAAASTLVGACHHPRRSLNIQFWLRHSGKCRVFGKQYLLRESNPN
jgi:hypothetical protein